MMLIKKFIVMTMKFWYLMDDARVEWHGVMPKVTYRNLPRQILLLTARDSLEDKVAGLDSGADDYLVKPFEFQNSLPESRL